MTDYILRLDALRAIQKQRCANTSPAQNSMLDRIRCDIVTLPAADVAPRASGQWILRHTATGNPYTECSNCCTDFSFKTDKGTIARLDMRGMPYCPHCGVKMERGIEP